jgi:Ca2+-binding RTX toxin-like protein
MATTLPQDIFDLIGVTNGGWTPFRVSSPLLVNGTLNSDDIAVTPIALSVFNGNDGNDRITIVGNLALATTLNGGRGEDQIFGGRGIDTIDGGNGNDYIVGGAAVDILQDTGTGDDDGDGIPDTDTISYEDAVALSGSVTGITLTLNASGGASMIPGDTDAGIDLILSGFENVVGSWFNDVITGNDQNNVLVGRLGDDRLFGGNGNDTLYDGEEPDDPFTTDILDGGAGDDEFFSVRGVNIMIGGAGSDIFWNSAYADSTIKYQAVSDFALSDSIQNLNVVDIIDLSAIDAPGPGDAFHFGDGPGGIHIEQFGTAFVQFEGLDGQMLPGGIDVRLMFRDQLLEEANFIL